MTILAGLSGREARKAFERDGWSFVRQTASHMIMKKPGHQATLSIPDHRTLKMPLLRGLIRAAGLTVERFIELLG